MCQLRITHSCHNTALARKYLASFYLVSDKNWKTKIIDECQSLELGVYSAIKKAS